MALLRGGVMLAAVLIGLGACTVRLAPDYDASLVDGLNKVNAETLVLFVSLQKGVTAASFPQYEARYDAAIGAFSALRLQADARFVPPLSQAMVTRIEAALPSGSVLAGACRAAVDCVNPTPLILDSIIGTLSEVEAVHERKGFWPVSPEVAGQCSAAAAADASSVGIMPYECSYLHDVEEALFVETSLRRN